MGRKETPFPHLHFMAQSVPPPQSVIMLGKGTRHDHCQGPRPECSVPPPPILHFNHCLRLCITAIATPRILAYRPTKTQQKLGFIIADINAHRCASAQPSLIGTRQSARVPFCFPAGSMRTAHICPPAIFTGAMTVSAGMVKLDQQRLGGSIGRPVGIVANTNCVLLLRRDGCSMRLHWS